MISPLPRQWVKSLRHLFQWSYDKGEASGYAFSTTISSVQTGFVSTNMTENNNNDDLRHRMKTQEQNSRAQQAVLENIQQMLAQLLNNLNNDDTTSSNQDEENLNNEPPKIERSKEGSTVDAKVIKGIHTQIASLAQRDELKDVGMTRPYPLEQNSVPHPLKFKPPMLHSTAGRAHRINTSITFGRKLVM